jgi:hypothetical protein
MVCTKASALVQNKDQELVADMSAGNDINVKGQGQTLLAQLET